MTNILLDVYPQLTENRELNEVSETCEKYADEHLTDEEYALFAKELGLKGFNTRKRASFAIYDLDSQFDYLVPTDEALARIEREEQEKAHELLLKYVAEKEEKALSEAKLKETEEAIKQLEDIASAKGMTLDDLGSQRKEENPIIQAQADELATGLKTKAEANEKKYTNILTQYEMQEYQEQLTSFEELQGKIDSGEIQDYRVLVGLDNNVKGINSMSRKILTEYKKHLDGVPMEDCTGVIHDSLRYTMLIDDEHYIKDTKEIINDLREKGYLVTVKNLWGNKAYQGVNTAVTDRQTGFTFELQFHTKDSYYTKEHLTHDYYAIFRNDYTTEEEKALANKIQMYYQSQVPVPDGIIGETFD